MNLGLTNKVAIVLGASKGLGKGVAKALAQEGVNVVIGAREEKTLSKTARDIQKLTKSKILAIPTDVGKSKNLETIVERTVKEYGKINILVNNAGGPPAGIFESIKDEQWQKAFEQNLLSAVRLIRLVLPQMKKSGSGRIINMVSTSVKEPVDNLILSNAIRASVIGMAKTLSREFAPFNITVNNVCPGRFLTDRIRHLYNIDERSAQGVSPEKVYSEAVKDIPLQRLGNIEEFGALVAFLASEQAGYITGTTIQIDGGLVRSIF
ncbi:SDR family oxidoreductase [Candidatus Gottesmanbacteria bacterium]|nr:SDR family oxidoreductase [Candidatus Gottesmanbacteria bacterium]